MELFMSFGTAEMRNVLVYVNALARYVHASGLRGQSTGVVRNAEVLYDKAFPCSRGLIEPAPNGKMRLISPDESLCFNVKPSDEGYLFKYL